MELSIILVNWQSKEMLRACLRSIAASELPFEYEILVIDNSPGDGCAEMLASQFPSVRYLASGENLGFARANNQAFLSSRGGNVLFLNPDTEVTPSAISVLMHQLSTLPDAGLVGARLFNTDGSLQESCVQAFPSVLNQVFDSEFLRHLFPHASLWGNRVLFDPALDHAPVDAVSGACMLISREVFTQAGMFSTEYFMYAEDVDLCRRVRELGKAVYYCARAEILHHGGQSSAMEPRSNRMTVVMRESRYTLLRRWRGVAYANLYRASCAVAAMLRLFLLAVLALPANHARRQVLHCARQKWQAIFAWAVGARDSATLVTARPAR